MGLRKFKYSKYPSKITSDDEALANFQILYFTPSWRYPEDDRAARWVLKWDDIIVSFKQRRSQGDALNNEYLTDGRIKYQFNFIWGALDNLGIDQTYPDQKTYPSQPFEGFSSIEKQEEVIALFLEAMTVFETSIRVPKKPTGVLAVIGPELRHRLNEGEYLQRTILANRQRTISANSKASLDRRKAKPKMDVAQKPLVRINSNPEKAVLKLSLATRLIYFALFFFSCGFSLLSLLFMRDGGSWFLIIFPALSILAFWAATRPASIELTPKMLTLRLGFSKKSHDWLNVSHFSFQPSIGGYALMGEVKENGEINTHQLGKFDVSLNPKVLLYKIESYRVSILFKNIQQKSADTSNLP